MQRLLAPDGCPWDREQTLESLRNYVIEEAHEVVDAIDRGSIEDLREELGDLLLQIVFQAELARARDWFGPDDVIASICDKLVRRHPHVFGDTSVSNAREVVANWEIIKAKDNGVFFPRTPIWTELADAMHRAVQKVMLNNADITGTPSQGARIFVTGNAALPFG